MRQFDFNLQDKSCLICGSDKLCKFEAKAYDAELEVDGLAVVNIVECRVCGFAWQFPVGRTEEKSVRYFETAYSDGGESQSAYFDKHQKREIAKLEAGFIATLPVKDKKLLDIGAGAGIFAEVAAECDWAVTAVDPAIDVGRFDKNSTIRAIKGTTDHLPDGELFDIISLWDVIEHAANPVELIHDADSRLKEGGWMVIETGNYKSADRVSGGLNHWIYQLDHRYYFSPESMRRLLIDAGFSDFVYADKVLRPGWNGRSVYAGPSISQLLRSFVKDPRRLPAHLSKFFALTKAKEWEMSGIGIFTIAARKPGKEN